MNAKLIRLPAVKQLTCMSTSTIYVMMARGDFPKPVKLGARAVAWRVDEIEQWIESRPAVA